MGDCSFYSEEAFEGLWSLEDSWTQPPIEKFHINLCQEFGFSPHLEQGISLLEEISSIEDNGLSKENTSIDDQQLQDSIFSSLLDTSDDPNSNMFVEVQESNQYVFRNNTCTPRVDSNIVDKEVNGAGKRSLVGRGSCSKANKERKSKITNFETDKRGVQTERVKEDLLAKKQDHNAKERMRRMKLHATYLALGSLLPIQKISKKRWTAPVIIDKVLDYIPELESEIEQLTHEKDRIVSAIDENKQLLLVADKLRMDLKATKDLTVSVNEVRQGGLILQICRKREIDEAVNVFSKLLQKIEDESIRLVSASTLHVCDERECYNIHIQMNESTSFANRSDYVTALKEQFISWLS